MRRPTGGRWDPADRPLYFLASTPANLCAVRDGYFLPVVGDPTILNCLVIDDLVDSGATVRPYLDEGFRVAVLLVKPVTPVDLRGRLVVPDVPVLDGWLQFPWEHDGAPTDAVTRLLTFMGEDPSRDGLRETPARVVKALAELTSGYRENPSELLRTTFEQTYDEMVVLSGVRFHSLCEHHLLPFSGTATVGYIPTTRVVGISKLARLVLCFAHRLQIQERLTSQIAEVLMSELQAKGAGVVVRAKHHCMGCRGVKQPDTEMVTSAMLGFFRTDAQARSEFLALARE